MRCCAATRPAGLRSACGHDISRPARDPIAEYLRLLDFFGAFKKTRRRSSYACCGSGLAIVQAPGLAWPPARSDAIPEETAFSLVVAELGMAGAAAEVQGAGSPVPAFAPVELEEESPRSWHAGLGLPIVELAADVTERRGDAGMRDFQDVTRALGFPPVEVRTSDRVLAPTDPR
jgi:hypothetical protein